jgi:hypothetical protein
VTSKVEETSPAILIRSVQESLQGVGKQTTRLNAGLKLFNEALQTIKLPPSINLAPMRESLATLEEKSVVEQCMAMSQYRKQLEAYLEANPSSDPAGLAILHQLIMGLDKAVNQLTLVSRTFVDMAGAINGSTLGGAPALPPTPPSASTATATAGAQSKPTAASSGSAGAKSPTTAAAASPPAAAGGQSAPSPKRSSIFAASETSTAVSDRLAEETRSGTPGFIQFIPVCPEFAVSFTSGSLTFGPFYPDQGGKVAFSALYDMLSSEGPLAQAAAGKDMVQVGVSIDQPVGRNVFTSIVSLPILTLDIPLSKLGTPIIDTKLAIFSTSFFAGDAPVGGMEVTIKQSGVDGLGKAYKVETNAAGGISIAAPNGLEVQVAPADARFPAIMAPVGMCCAFSMVDQPRPL